MGTTYEHSHKAEVGILLTTQHILLKLPKDEADIQFLRGLGRAHWDHTSFCWVIPRKEETLDKLKQYFAARLIWQEAQDEEVKPVLHSKAAGKIAIVRFQKGRIRLIFRYDKGLINLVKSLPFPFWDKENQWWTLPHTENILLRIRQYCEQRGIEISDKSEA